MSAAAFKNLQRATELFTRFNPEKFNKIISREERVDRYEDRLGAYLVRLHTQPLSDKETQTSAKYLTCLSNVERISDHAVNLAELAQDLFQKQMTFSPQAMQELTVCTNAIHEIIQLANAAMTMGIDGVFMEVHKDPDHAMSDGPNQVYLKDLEKILSNLMLVRKACQQMATI